MAYGLYSYGFCRGSDGRPRRSKRTMPSTPGHTHIYACIHANHAGDAPRYRASTVYIAMAYRYGLYSHGLHSDGLIVMAYIVMAIQLWTCVETRVSTLSGSSAGSDGPEVVMALK